MSPDKKISLSTRIKKILEVINNIFFVIIFILVIGSILGLIIDIFRVRK